MKFGVNIINFGAGTDPESLEGWARFAEDRGFDFAMISDHVAITEDVARQYPAPFYDPFATLAWLAGRTSRIGLGTTVAVLPYRHPLLTARLAADIDRFSGGRLILGVGVSWPRQEFAALGVPYDRRGAIADEYLDVITRAWTAERLSYEGEFVSFSTVQTGPRPLSAPPIWVGGSSPAALRRAVRFGDAWHPLNVRVERLAREGLPALRAAAADLGRPVPALAPRLRLRITDAPMDEDARLAGEGTLDQIRGDLARLAEMDATHVLFDTYPGTPAEQRSPADDQRLLDTLADALLDLTDRRPR